MEKLRALSSYLLGSELFAPDQLSSRAEQVTLNLNWKPEAEGLCMGVLEYRGVLEFYRTTVDPVRLIALVCAWLQRHDSNPELHTLSLPGCTVSPQVDQRHHLQLILNFKESIWLSEQPDGEFEIFHKRWAFLPSDLWTAEQSEVLNRPGTQP